MRDELAREYNARRPLYVAYCECADRLIRNLLADAHVQAHSVTTRAKTEVSLGEKLSRPGKHYQNLEDVTDLAGIRITVYFAEDVDQVAEIVEHEFQVHHELSADKRTEIATDSFGYQSLHLVVELQPPRTKLPEYSRFRGLKAEIQVRTILQHAWAEIEHDLGYKTASDVPQPVRRRFAKLAALLELADDEFGRIRDELDTYADEVALKVESEPGATGLDVVSLSKFVSSSDITARIVSRVRELHGDGFSFDEPHDWLDGLPLAFRLLGAETIEGVAALLGEYEDYVVACWDLVFSTDEYQAGGVDMVLFVLVLVAAVLTTKPGGAQQLFSEFKILPADDFEGSVRERVSGGSAA